MTEDRDAPWEGHDTCEDYGHHGRERCVVCGIARTGPVTEDREAQQPCENCDHGTDPKTLTTCAECGGTGIVDREAQQ